MSKGDPFDLPSAQYIAPDLVLLEMAKVGAKRAASLSVLHVLILSTMAGAFITIGALFAVLISAGTTDAGVEKLLEGFGFSTGFFLVILTGALLFTEINVEMPATLLGSGRDSLWARAGRLWLLAAVGNFIGAFLAGWAIATVSNFTPQVQAHLADIVEAKMRFRGVGSAQGWFKAVLSGAIANWLVGLAAFLSVMGRTIIGKYIPVVLIVTMFVAGGFLHAPANMGFFSLAAHTGSLEAGWLAAFQWSILPASLGNVLGGVFLVAIPFWFVVTSTGADKSSRRGS